ASVAVVQESAAQHAQATDRPCQQLSNDWLAGGVPGQGIQVALDDDGGRFFVHGQAPKDQGSYRHFMQFLVHPDHPRKSVGREAGCGPTGSRGDQPSNQGDSPMANTTSRATISRDGAPHPVSPVAAPVRVVKRRSWRRWALGIAGLLVVAAGGVYVAPSVMRALSTVSTDDAYVNGHVTFVAPRVAGKVIEVLVDDNNPVKKGDLLVRIDPEPFQVQVNLKRAAVQVAEGDLAAAESQARGLEALARSQRWKTENASEMVNNQVALLRARVATLRTKEATLARAKADFERGRRMLPSGAISREEFDVRQQDIRVAEASVDQAREDVYQVRASLGLPPQPPQGKPLTDAPPDLDQTYSEVRTAL